MKIKACLVVSIITIFFVCLLIVVLLKGKAVSDFAGTSVVNCYGQLFVRGTNLCAENGNPIQLRGVSSHGLQWYGVYANEDVISWLRDDWNIQVWRAAMYTAEGGYISEISTQSDGIKSKVVASIEAAIKFGIYVIIDWHILQDGDPRLYQAEALSFFSEMAQLYGNYPNVIYEICNEPNSADVTWDNAIKPYAEAVIAEIRRYDPDNIIIVGTPTWSQDVDIASVNQIKGYNNIMYALHFYAGTHQEALRNKAQQAMQNGIALFVTECGTTSASGDGEVYVNETLDWFSFLNRNRVSWVIWSLADKDESSALLLPGVDKQGKGGWTEGELTFSGQFIRKILRGEIPVSQ